MGLLNRMGEWKRKREERAEQRRIEEEKARQKRIKQLSDFEKGKLPKLSVKNVSVVFKKNEIVHRAERTNLYEPRSVRNYGGGSIRIAKGIRLHAGQAESHLENRQIDSGSLILTSQRLVFVGGLRTTSIDLRKIFNIIPFEDGFQINREGKNRPESFSSEDSEVWAASIKGAIKNLKGKRDSKEKTTSEDDTDKHDEEMIVDIE